MQIFFGQDELVILKNQKGVEVHILTLGAIIQKLRVPDKTGSMGDVVLGFDDLEPYQASPLSDTFCHPPSGDCLEMSVLLLKHFNTGKPKQPFFAWLSYHEHTPDTPDM